MASACSARLRCVLAGVFVWKAIAVGAQQLPDPACSRSGQTVTCTFNAATSSGSITIPSNVRMLDSITAVGGRGGNSGVRRLGSPI